MSCYCTTRTADTSRDYLLSVAYPDVLRELSGLTIAAPYDQYDRAMTIAPGAPHVDVLVEATDDSGQTYPVFVRFQVQDEADSVFVDTGLHYDNLEDKEL